MTKLKTLDDIAKIHIHGIFDNLISVNRLRKEAIEWLNYIESKREPYQASAFIREFYNIKYDQK